MQSRSTFVLQHQLQGLSALYPFFTPKSKMQPRMPNTVVHPGVLHFIAGVFCICSKHKTISRQLAYVTCSCSLASPQTHDCTDMTGSGLLLLFRRLPVLAPSRWCNGNVLSAAVMARLPCQSPPTGGSIPCKDAKISQERRGKSGTVLT